MINLHKQKMSLPNACQALPNATIFYMRTTPSGTGHWPVIALPHFANATDWRNGVVFNSVVLVSAGYSDLDFGCFVL